MGVELSVSVAFPVCQSPGDHGPGARHCLWRHRDAPEEKSPVLLARRLRPAPSAGETGEIFRLST